MCELFTMCSSSPLNPGSELAAFREFADRNPDGWGIGSYNENGNTSIQKKAGSALTSSEYASAAGVVTSRIVVAHLRDASRKNTVLDINAHPFLLSFLGRSWMFAHNGSISVDYETTGDRLDATVDSARLFEFMRDEVSTWLSRKTSRSLFQAVKRSTTKCYREFRGTANFVLTDGELIFVNKDGQHRNRIYLRVIRHGSDAIQFCTRRLDPEGWVRAWKPSTYRSRLMLASRGRLLFNSRIAA
ncbi:MAG TPA: class II glutamine amidotransferase [Candidatus Acidoferrum sp.]|nr:class II glutamine amidotransferase [Candidatus Acidoferrum sp.]